MTFTLIEVLQLFAAPVVGFLAVWPGIVWIPDSLADMDDPPDPYFG